MKNRIDIFSKIVYELSYAGNKEYEWKNMETKEQANLLLYEFENNKFLNAGRYDYRINLIFEFDEYIRNLPDNVLAEHLCLNENENVAVFRKMVESGIDAWLDSSFIKTLTLY